MNDPRRSALMTFRSPYDELIPFQPAHWSSESSLGDILVWRLTSPTAPVHLDLARSRPGSVALVTVLPPSRTLDGIDDVLEMIELCRPHSVLPHHVKISTSDLRALLQRAPADLPESITDYLTWRGICPDLDTQRLIRQIIALSETVKTVSGLARSVYMSRRALGRRFQTRGLPVPSHWLHFARLLRATLKLQSSGASLFDVACDLGYPDGFALSNQMTRLTGIRPSVAKELLGWEWLFDAWLRTEADGGSVSKQVLRKLDTDRRQQRGDTHSGRSSSRRSRTKEKEPSGATSAA